MLTESPVTMHRHQGVYNANFVLHLKEVLRIQILYMLCAAFSLLMSAWLRFRCTLFRRPNDISTSSNRLLKPLVWITDELGLCVNCVLVCIEATNIYLDSITGTYFEFHRTRVSKLINKFCSFYDWIMQWWFERKALHTPPFEKFFRDHSFTLICNERSKN